MMRVFFLAVLLFFAACGGPMFPICPGSLPPAPSSSPPTYWQFASSNFVAFQTTVDGDPYTVYVAGTVPFPSQLTPSQMGDDVPVLVVIGRGGAGGGSVAGSDEGGGGGGAGAVLVAEVDRAALFGGILDVDVGGTYADAIVAGSVARAGTGGAGAPGDALNTPGAIGEPSTLTDDAVLTALYRIGSGGGGASGAAGSAAGGGGNVSGGYAGYIGGSGTTLQGHGSGGGGTGQEGQPGDLNAAGGAGEVNREFVSELLALVQGATQLPGGGAGGCTAFGIPGIGGVQGGGDGDGGDNDGGAATGYGAGGGGAGAGASDHVGGAGGGPLVALFVRRAVP